LKLLRLSKGDGSVKRPSWGWRVLVFHFSGKWMGVRGKRLVIEVEGSPQPP